jgi:hypothetical protein
MRTIVTEIEYDCGCKLIPQRLNLERALAVGFDESNFEPFCRDHPTSPAIRVEKDVRIDNSGIESMWLCDRRHLYASEQHLRPMLESNALDYGSMLHWGFENFWKGVKEGLAYEDAGIKAEDAFMEMWLDKGGLVDDVRNDELARAIFANYPIFVQNTELAGDKWEPEAAEVAGGIFLQTIKVGIENHNIFYVINVDLTVHCRGKRWIVDYKSHKNSGFYPMWIKPWQTSSQMTGYIYTYRQLVGDEVAGVFIVGVLVKMLKAGPAPDFIIIPVEKTDGLLEEWRRDLLATYQRLIINRRSGHWAKNDKACDKWGGCPYIELCVTDPSLRQLSIDSNFRRVVWDADQRKAFEVDDSGIKSKEREREFNIDILAQLDKT